MRDKNRNSMNIPVGLTAKQSLIWPCSMNFSILTKSNQLQISRDETECLP